MSAYNVQKLLVHVLLHFTLGGEHISANRTLSISISIVIFYPLPIVAAICTDCNDGIILTKGTDTPDNKISTLAGIVIIVQIHKYLVPPGISILEKLHSEEKYFGRNEADARLC